jgi:hypothetical protein
MAAVCKKGHKFRVQKITKNEKMSTKTGLKTEGIQAGGGFWD